MNSNISSLKRHSDKITTAAFLSSYTVSTITLLVMTMKVARKINGEALKSYP